MKLRSPDRLATLPPPPPASCGLFSLPQVPLALRCRGWVGIWARGVLPARNTQYYQHIFPLLSLLAFYPMINAVSSLAPSSICPPSTPSAESIGKSRTRLNSLHAGSLGCAPTPIQYRALAVSSLMSLKGLPSPSVGGLGIGS